MGGNPDDGDPHVDMEIGANEKGMCLLIWLCVYVIHTETYIINSDIIISLWRK